MNTNKTRFISDIALICLLLLMFISILFLCSNADTLMANLLLLCGVYIIMLITYFTNITTGLLLDAIGIFIGFTITLYFSYVKGFKIPDYAYFWAIVYPAFTVLIALFTKSHLELQRQATALSRTVSELATIDGPTGLKNQRSFIHDTDIYMKLSKRYNHNLFLILLELRHKQELTRLLSKQDMDNLLIYVSDTLQHTLRREDQIYLIDRNKAEWGILLISNGPNSVNLIVERLKSNITSMKIESDSKFNQLHLDMRIGVSVYTPSISTPLEFIEKAKKEMEYDVS